MPNSLQLAALCAGKPVAIFGAGVSGQALASLLRRHRLGYRIYDQKPNAELADTRTVFDEAAAAEHRLVLISPGFAQNHPWVKAARAAGAQVMGETDFAALFWRGPIVAVTGTNGKTTLTTFLGYALERDGTAAVTTGNIGYPLSKVVETDTPESTVAVCEVSSFQAEGCTHFSPHALLWTNFDEDHLERHADMREYFAAKWTLVERLRRPCLIVGRSVAQWAEKLGYQLPPFTKIVDGEGSADAGGKDRAGTGEKGGMRADGQGACGAEREVFPGIFAEWPQRENYAIAREYWNYERRDPQALAAAAETFPLPPHRLQVVDTVNGRTFWNDSKATNFHAALAALKRVPGPVVWIGGGKLKGGDVNGFARLVAPQIAAACLIGESAPQLEQQLRAAGVSAIRLCAGMQEAVHEAYTFAPSGASILLSPGFASLDMFSGYAQRGESFQSVVLGLKLSPSSPTV